MTSIFRNATNSLWILVLSAGFFWDGRGEDGTDTLFMVYHAYTAPTGVAQMRIHPVYLDNSDWLTMDENEGTVITQTTEPTSVGSGSMKPSSNRSRLIAVTGMEQDVPMAALYGLKGQKISGEAGSVPTGIYIVEPTLEP